LFEPLLMWRYAPGPPHAPIQHFFWCIMVPFWSSWVNAPFCKFPFYPNVVDFSAHCRRVVPPLPESFLEGREPSFTLLIFHAGHARWRFWGGPFFAPPHPCPTSSVFQVRIPFFFPHSSPPIWGSPCLVFRPGSSRSPGRSTSPCSVF